MPPSISCPLCDSLDLYPYHEDEKRLYHQCGFCELVFVPSLFWLSLEQEKHVYDLHENHVHDHKYQKFLSRLAKPLLERLKAYSKGLDFGCGSGPALQFMLQQSGHEVCLYDLHYYPCKRVLDTQYDFICATEVVEHLKSPRETFLQIKHCLKPNAIFAVMTQLIISPERFVTWRYIQDPTHVCFFNIKSLSYVAELMDRKLEHVDRDVIFIR